MCDNNVASSLTICLRRSRSAPRYCLILSAFVLLAIAPASRAQSAPDKPLPEKIDFNRDIRPILSDNCYACHGPDKNKRKAELRLDTKDGIFSTHRGSFNGPPGKPQQSELFRRVTAADPKERMPDPKSNKRLTDREIALLGKWIEQGATWQGHWAYLKITRPAVPQADDQRFVHNSIDNFILATPAHGRFAACRRRPTA